ncbi:hypothetical protein HMPREF9943_01712 [Eggerthia catenaformis OT 569 = DSM 20559]|uniref:NfeD-like C-terminal domain-containing protein n=1 Tax=Eggerthia catenaformis OT 569 = DSM 20559 TaxID=999415 RepID=M2PZE2_9FIRM|nr:NfeD family protein [Eggerthia catenaformis]EMD16040.1 hypothetical protein HMPREF9943_01712 [Eggerthia catenaformis OT 569 = DSM 20559]OUC50757.1 hypothetical protein B7939_10010 [Eggerthia catenaformis]
MNMSIFWSLIVIISAIIEVATVTLVSIWFTIGAACALLCQLLGASIQVQISIFMIVSAICVIVSRPLARKMLHGNITKTNTDSIIGQIGIVSKKIHDNQKGEVKIRDTYWRAQSLNDEFIDVNEKVEILAIEGAHIIVRKV